jgi:ribosomal protein S15P/S13E
MANKTRLRALGNAIVKNYKMFNQNDFCDGKRACTAGFTVFMFDQQLHKEFQTKDLKTLIQKVNFQEMEFLAPAQKFLGLSDCQASYLFDAWYDWSDRDFDDEILDAELQALRLTSEFESVQVHLREELKDFRLRARALEVQRRIECVIKGAK